MIKMCAKSNGKIKKILRSWIFQFNKISWDEDSPSKLNFCWWGLHWRGDKCEDFFSVKFPESFAVYSGLVRGGLSSLLSIDLISVVKIA